MALLLTALANSQGARSQPERQNAPARRLGHVRRAYRARDAPWGRIEHVEVMKYTLILAVML